MIGKSLVESPYVIFERVPTMNPALGGVWMVERNRFRDNVSLREVAVPRVHVVADDLFDGCSV